MTLEGLSSVCAKLEPASSKHNEILEINVLQKGPVKLIKRVKIAHSFLQSKNFSKPFSTNGDIGHFNLYSHF